MAKTTENKTEINHPNFKEKTMLTVSENTTASFELPPAGPTAARCCRLIDLGSQQSEFNGEKKMQRKILLTWELAETPHRRNTVSGIPPLRSQPARESRATRLS